MTLLPIENYDLSQFLVRHIRALFLIFFKIFFFSPPIEFAIRGSRERGRQTPNSDGQQGGQSAGGDRCSSNGRGRCPGEKQQDWRMVAVSIERDRLEYGRANGEVPVKSAGQLRISIQSGEEIHRGQATGPIDYRIPHLGY